MKIIAFILLATFSLGLYAQNPNYTRDKACRGTSDAYVIFDRENKPVKVYADAIDAIHFCTHNPYSNQQINLYYAKYQDTTLWEPNNKMYQDNIWNPESVGDQFLAIDTVYLVMQKNFKLADRAFTAGTYDASGRQYAENHGLEVIKIPYYYRDKRSFDEVYRIKRERLQQR